MIASVAFGIDVDCIQEPESEFRRYGQRFFEPNPTNMFRFHLAFIYPKLAKLLRLRFTDKDVGDFMTETVRQTVDYREQNGIVRKDLLQLLIQLRNYGQVKENDDDWSANIETSTLEKDDCRQNRKKHFGNMSIEEMSAHAFVFYTASFESSSTTMSYCMFELAKKPEIQREVHTEIDTILSKYNGELTYESIAEMKFMDRCIDGEFVVKTEMTE